MAAYRRFSYTLRNMFRYTSKSGASAIAGKHSLIVPDSRDRHISEGGHCIFYQIHRVICWRSDAKGIYMETYNRRKYVVRQHKL